MLRYSTRWILALVAFAFIGSPVLPQARLLAHHGWSGYSNEPFEITGTVETPVSLSGPHATMKIRADGKLWTLMRQFFSGVMTV